MRSEAILPKQSNSIYPEYPKFWSTIITYTFQIITISKKRKKKLEQNT